MPQGVTAHPVQGKHVHIAQPKGPTALPASPAAARLLAIGAVTRVKDACGAGQADRPEARSMTRRHPRARTGSSAGKGHTRPVHYACKRLRECETAG